MRECEQLHDRRAELLWIPNQFGAVLLEATALVVSWRMCRLGSGEGEERTGKVRWGVIRVRACFFTGEWVDWTVLCFWVTCTIEWIAT